MYILESQKEEKSASGGSLYLIYGYFSYVKDSFNYSKIKFAILLIPLILQLFLVIIGTVFVAGLTIFLKSCIFISFIGKYLVATSKEDESKMLSEFKKEWKSIPL